LVFLVTSSVWCKTSCSFSSNARSPPIYTYHKPIFLSLPHDISRYHKYYGTKVHTCHIQSRISDISHTHCITQARSSRSLHQVPNLFQLHQAPIAQLKLLHSEPQSINTMSHVHFLM
jgi:hypothetical protein